MKNPLKFGKKIMFVSWNFDLSYSLSCFFEAMALELGLNTHLVCIYRAKAATDYCIKPKEIWDGLYQFEPDILVIDPVKISCPPYPDQDQNKIYYDGLRIVHELDGFSGGDFNQIVWTTLLPEDLPSLYNSFYLEQEIRFPPFYEYVFDGLVSTFCKAQYLNQGLKVTFPHFFELLTRVSQL